MSKYGEWTRGQDEALLNKLGGMKNALKLLACDKIDITFQSAEKRATVTAQECCWREESGVIYFSVVSDGTSGSDWISRLEKQDFRLSSYAKDMLRSPDFKPTSGVTYDVAILKGDLFGDRVRVTKSIRSQAENRQLITPNAEVACLIRERFSDAQLETVGLWAIVVMHEPIADSDGAPRLLSVDRYDDGRWLRAYYGKPGNFWSGDDRFVFLASQVSSLNSSS